MFKVLFPTLLFISAICSAQTYHFDYSVSYRITKMNSEIPQIKVSNTLINSENHTFKFIIHKDNSKIMDFENSKLHYFRNEKGGKLIYLESKNNDFKPEFKIGRIEVKEISSLNFSIKTFKRENSKKPNFYLIVTLEKSKTDLLNALHLDFNAFLEEKIFAALREKLDKKSNYSISKAEIHYSKDYVFLEEPIEIAPINFTLSVDE